MAFNLESISNEKRSRAPRILLYGIEKIGKSTFAAGSDKPIFISMKKEEGIDELAVGKFPVCEKFSDVIEALTTICCDKHDYRTVVIDSGSTLERLIYKEVCIKGGKSSIEDFGYAKGYTYSLDYWSQIIDALDYLRNEKNMTSIIISHAKIKRFDDPMGASYDQYQSDMNQQAWSMIAKWVDCILFAGTKTVTRKEDVGFGVEKNKAIDLYNGQRFLYTGKNPAYIAGGRTVYGRLPNEIPLSWNEFIKVVEIAYQQSQQQ